MKPKVAVAVSGGVDSGVAAALVVKAGFRVAGFHMKLWQETLAGAVLSAPGAETSMRSGRKRFVNKCCDLESLEAARKTCRQLGIPFYIVDFEKIFKKRVVDYFLAEYAAGRTPNPCVICNKFIKFGRLLDYVRGLGYDYLATGHYARIFQGCLGTNFSLMSASKDEENAPRQARGTSAQIRSKLSPRAPGKKSIYHLLTGCDQSKDQSYFLYSLTQKQLAHVLFPVGDFWKKEVVEMAKKGPPAGGLPVAERPESQEICFFPESDYRPFLKRHLIDSIQPGEIIDTEGRVIGKHQGLPLYTIGQRHGFKITTNNKQQTTKGIIPPFYVIAKDTKENRLVVGFGKETEGREFLVGDVNWVNLPIVNNQQSAIKCFVRIRHGGELLRCRVRRNTQYAKSKTKYTIRKSVSCITHHVSLSDPQRGIAPGQAAVFYRKRKMPAFGEPKARPGENGKWKIGDYEVLGGGIISFDD